jgi:hypothetical protein
VLNVCSITSRLSLRRGKVGRRHVESEMKKASVPISSPRLRNPLAELQPALSAITEAGVRVLPATGQAIEDLMRPDQDESYDRVRLGASADGVLDRVEDGVTGYVEVAPRHRTQDHVFRHFWMGRHGLTTLAIS